MILDSARSEIQSQYLDATRAALVLGWRPSIDLETGLVPNRCLVPRVLSSMIPGRTNEPLVLSAVRRHRSLRARCPRP